MTAKIDRVNELRSLIDVEIEKKEVLDLSAPELVKKALMAELEIEYILN